MNSDNLMINATEAIRKDIIYGEYKLGEPLSEIKICKKYHLSKTPVREALAILQNEGLVNRIARRGSFVFDITVSEIKQIAESRYLLENYAIQNSMIASPQILVNKLTEIYENMVKAAHLNDHVAFLDLDTEFHKSFFISCNNDYLVNFYNVLSNKSQALKYFVVKNAIEGGGGLISHKSILDDVKNNNINALSENLKQHLTEWINKYILNTKLNSSY
jgi:DNA-binding GntR family transcriptional regulator